MQKLEFYVTAAPGTEEALRDELSELGFAQVRLNRGGIPFFGSLEDGWRACLETRLGQRVMLLLGRYAANSPQSFYEGALKLPWQLYLSPAQSISTAAYVHESQGENPNFVALKLKDAIVDSQRQHWSERSDVERQNPDLRAFAYWSRGKASVYLDLSGEPLFKRGYRLSGGQAPLKETMAAAVLRLAGWDRKTPLIDPMCGSASLLIEAALWAGNVAPGIWRQRFGFERWANFDELAQEKMSALRGACRHKSSGQHPRITGSDIDPEALKRAQENARSAGLRLSFRQMPLRELQPEGQRRFLVCNPPYGVRLEAENRLFQELGSAIQRLHGWRCAILAGTPACLRNINLPPQQLFNLKNGSIDCQLAVYEVP
ncbi:MAG: methyltransferase [Lentisphaeria bacterium]|nr:methyltransferase [Lentisphaeria bacterium]